MRWSKPNTKVVIIVKNTIETNSNDPSLGKNPKYLSIKFTRRNYHRYFSKRRGQFGAVTSE